MLHSFRAGGLGSARPGRSGLPGVLADLVSFPYLTCVCVFVCSSRSKNSETIFDVRASSSFL